MNATTGADLCRVVIVAPHRRLDLSLPAGIPLSHMLPTLLQVAGPDLADDGLVHSGWILQRLDEPPFDESQSLTSLGIRDGEILYFRPELAQLPEVVFDDVADVVATGVNDRPDRWRPETTRRCGLLVTAATLLVGAAAIALTGPPWHLLAAASGCMAVLLLLAGAVLSRALGDAGAGAVLGYSALPYAFLGGLLAPARPVALQELGALHLLAASGAVTLAAAIAAFTVLEGLPTFLGIALTGLLGLIATTVTEGFGLPPEGTAAFTASLCVALTALIPSLAFRLARLPLPPVPENAEELRSAQTFDGPTLLHRTQEADRFATGLVAAVALTGLGAHLTLLTADGWPPFAMALCLSLVLLLRARVFLGRSQRLWMIGSGLTGLAVLALGQTGSPATTLITVLLPIALAAMTMTVMALRLPVHKPSPFWGRAGDIVDIMLIVSLLPLAMGLLNLYTWLRGLAG
ncbi:type VII secretion integral membrane protein EccD [Actinomadura cremea]|nr:type VII secretion integral membrane protein EccD [Actinomadura cremea]